MVAGKAVDVCPSLAPAIAGSPESRPFAHNRRRVLRAMCVTEENLDTPESDRQNAARAVAPEPRRISVPPIALALPSWVPNDVAGSVIKATLIRYCLYARRNGHPHTDSRPATIHCSAAQFWEEVMEDDKGQVTQLLKAMAHGDSSAAERLLPLVYAELHRLARSYMRGERPDHTLQATALINEAYLRLAREDNDWNSREHFIGVAANVMRKVLVDYARARNAEQRGGGLQKVELQEDLAISPEKLDEVERLDDALERLEKHNARQARIVELRYFGGLTIDQVASVIGVSPRSVKRDWSLARLWLFRQLEGTQTPAND